MKKVVKESAILKKPEFPGGTKALRAFVSKNLVYPEEARSLKIEGRVHLRYGIDHHGRVTEVHIIKGVPGGCTEEAIRLVKLLEFKLEKTRGVKVLFHKKIQIHFRLPPDKPAQQPPTQLNYSYSTTPTTEQSQLPKKKSYTITIHYSS